MISISAWWLTATRTKQTCRHFLCLIYLNMLFCFFFCKVFINFITESNDHSFLSKMISDFEYNVNSLLLKSLYSCTVMLKTLKINIGSSGKSTCVHYCIIMSNFLASVVNSASCYLLSGKQYKNFVFTYASFLREAKKWWVNIPIQLGSSNFNFLHKVLNIFKQLKNYGCCTEFASKTLLAYIHPLF